MKLKSILLVLVLAGLSSGLDGCLGSGKGRQAKLLTVDAKDLNSTLVTASLREPITAGTNLVWCGTFQLAWNGLMDMVGRDIQFEDMAEQLPAVQALNERLITGDDLDEASYVAMAGFVGDGIVPQIQQAMAAKFPDVTPNLPVQQDDDPRTIVAYAYLFKNLLFAKPFERLTEPLLFDGQEILCFGLSGHSSPDTDLLRQVSILDYLSDDDFVIELKTQSDADQVILAKVQPQATLEETIDQVLTRAAGGQTANLGGDDVLKVPMMNYDLQRSYDEFANHIFLAANGVADSYFIRDALQTIRFELNEAGVRLKSAAVIIGVPSSLPPTPKHLVFDKPFLLLMKLRAADQPYFAMWIDNPELLGKANK
jgi:hypothetical protein